MKHLLLITVVGLLAESCLMLPQPNPPHPHPPQPCKSPSEQKGEFSVITPSGEYSALGKYTYDADGQRIRFGELGQYQNKSFQLDILLLFKEGVKYTIDTEKQTCIKTELKDTFPRMEVPEKATLLGQVVLGSISSPGKGLLVNSWYGDIPKLEAKYLLTFTALDCVPITYLYYSQKTGGISTNYFNIEGEIKDKSPLTPPTFCANVEMTSEGDVDFFSPFF